MNAFWWSLVRLQRTAAPHLWQRPSPWCVWISAKRKLRANQCEKEKRKLWFLPDFLLWFLALKFYVCLARKLGLTNKSIHCGNWIKVVNVPLLNQWWSPSISEWHSDFISCLQFKFQFTSKHIFTEKSLHLAWDLSLCLLSLMAKTGTERLEGESVLHIQLYIICK